MTALRVSGLGMRYGSRQVLEGIDFLLAPGRTLGIVGESGSGKSSLARALVGLEPVQAGSISYGSRPWVQAGRFVGARQAPPAHLVFQDPRSALDPRRKAWQLIAEPLEIRGGATATERRARAAELCAQVGLDAQQLDRYAPEFSGGQRQRIAIARALAAQAEVLILDEPTSALDISVQAQILNLLLDLQAQRQMAFVLISHDLAVVRHLADEVLVMRAGRTVEQGAAEQVLERPEQAYTRRLIAAIPA
jgi:peptide/nickel transport system ATP-binding protein